MALTSVFPGTPGSFFEDRMKERNTIPVRTNLPPSLFLEFEKECEIDGLKHSTQVRIMIRNWVRHRRYLREQFKTGVNVTDSTNSGTNRL